MKILLTFLITVNVFAQIPKGYRKYRERKPPQKSSFVKALSNIQFNYFAKYTGKSLSGSYASGATFSRFDGGYQDGQDYDPTGSFSLYQSFRLGYRFSNSWTLAYGVTFQENLHDDVAYENIYGQELKRQEGKTYNNHRISLFVPNLYSTSIGWFSATYYAEIPNSSSINRGMHFGAGFQPSFSFYSLNSNFRYNIAASLERYVFNDEVERGAQGVIVQLVPSITYLITDKINLRHAFEFDWDQKGEDIQTTTFTRNMHDMGVISANFRLSSKIVASVLLGYSVSNMDNKNTTAGASLDINI